MDEAEGRADAARSAYKSAADTLLRVANNLSDLSLRQTFVAALEVRQALSRAGHSR
ncbi:MAG TPA: hypothetical protein VFD42_05390 [Chloroflexota bacterium]|nr:hypothetical protein [Chloroflexota bacterium]